MTTQTQSTSPTNHEGCCAPNPPINHTALPYAINSTKSAIPDLLPNSPPSSTHSTHVSATTQLRPLDKVDTSQIQITFSQLRPVSNALSACRAHPLNIPRPIPRRNLPSLPAPATYRCGTFCPNTSQLRQWDTHRCSGGGQRHLGPVLVTWDTASQSKASSTSEPN